MGKGDFVATSGVHNAAFYMSLSLSNIFEVLGGPFDNGS